MTNPTATGEHPFQVAGIDLIAFQVPDPRRTGVHWWALRVVENDKIYDPRDGSVFDHGSKAKLADSIEQTLHRVHKGDVDLLRHDLELPPRIERIRALAQRVGVSAEAIANGTPQWEGRTGPQAPAFRSRSEAQALLWGIRHCAALEDFVFSAPRYRVEDDTFLLVYAEQWLYGQQRSVAFCDERPESVGPDWYERRHELKAGMIFNTRDGVVMLERTVPGDGTRWYVADWNQGWSHYDSTIEPGELEGEPMTEQAFKAQALSEVDSRITIAEQHGDLLEVARGMDQRDRLDAQFPDEEEDTRRMKP